MKLEPRRIKEIVTRAVLEDIGKGDITTKFLIPKTRVVRAKIIARESGVVAGITIAKEVFRQVEKLLQRRIAISPIRFSNAVHDGDRVKEGQTIVELSGNGWVILSGERTALNFLTHLSGIATLVRRYVDTLNQANPQGRARIYDTRKTLPGLRYLEKYAVRCGGGSNHRMGLYDMVLVKDNHWQIVGDRRMAEVIPYMRRKVPRGMKIEIEVDTLERLKEVLQWGIDLVMLDNMNLSTLKKALKLVEKVERETGRRPLIEVSGRIDLRKLKQIAQLGIDMVSIGVITHSAKALDMSLEIQDGEENLGERYD